MGHEESATNQWRFTHHTPHAIQKVARWWYFIPILLSTYETHTETHNKPCAIGSFHWHTIYASENLQQTMFQSKSSSYVLSHTEPRTTNRCDRIPGAQRGRRALSLPHRTSPLGSVQKSSSRLVRGIEGARTLTSPQSLRTIIVTTATIATYTYFLQLF